MDQSGILPAWRDVVALGAWLWKKHGVFVHGAAEKLGCVMCSVGSS